MYIFPGVGLGAVSFECAKVSDAMFSAAARTLAEQMDDEALAAGCLFPDLAGIREISAHKRTIDGRCPGFVVGAALAAKGA